MRILFDNGTPRGVANEPPDHTVEECREHGADVVSRGGLRQVRLNARGSSQSRT
jgi:hypothetical protein